MVSTLEKRVLKLEGGSGPGAPGALGGWGKEWADFDLIADSGAILPWCSMDAFIVGRASWVAWKHCKPMVDSYRYWSNHQEPDWFTNEAYLSKPGSIEAVAAERAKYPPASALESFAAFSRWEYSGNGELHDHIAIASAVWLIDTLALPPQQVIDNGLSHARAWTFGFNELACVVAPEAMVMESPLIPLEGFPVPKPWAKRVAKDGPMEVLSMLLVVASGIHRDHGRGLFPTVKQ